MRIFLIILMIVFGTLGLAMTACGLFVLTIKDIAGFALVGVVPGLLCGLVAWWAYTALKDREAGDRSLSSSTGQSEPASEQDQQNKD